MVTKVPLLFSPKDDVEGLFSSIGISFLCHLIVLSLFLFSPFRAPRLNLSTSIINVDLVSVSSPGARTQSPPHPQKPTVKEETPPKEAPPPTPQPVVADTRPKTEEKVVLPSEPKEKVSLKKKTYQADKVKEKAIDRIEKNIENTKPNALAKAFERLQEKVATTPEREWEEGAEGGGVSGLSIGNQEMSSQLSIYRAEIFYHINKNWALPDQVAGESENLEVLLIIKIMSNGEIQDIEFEKKSGSDTLDESAIRAIKKSNPLPELPPEVRPYYIVKLRFSPTGLR